MPPPSPPPSFRARTTFFSTSFSTLHDLVLNHLAGEDSRHLVLPLLAVNRHWRKTAQDYLLRPFKHTHRRVQGSEGLEESEEEDSSRDHHVWEGEYVKVVIANFNVHDDPDQWSDPRIYFADKEVIKLEPEFADHPGNEPPTIPELVLVWKSFNPITNLCTFVPPREQDDNKDASNPLAMLDYPLVCLTESRLPYLAEPKFINVVPSSWFIPEKEPRKGLFGLDVAFDCERLPSPLPFGPALPLPNQAGGFERILRSGSDGGDELGWRPGWLLDVVVGRTDSKDEDPFKHHMRSPDGRRYLCHVVLAVRSLEIPLLDLYRPAGLTEPGWY